VDIGHTFSAALEMRLQPSLLHGECVAIDLALTVMLSEGRGLLDPGTAARIIRLLTALGVPIVHPEMNLTLVLNALADTRLHRDGLQRLPLLRDVASALFVSDVTRSELDGALRAIQAFHAQQAS
jgi:2-epi-5-epi-valiolone synthase